VAVPSWGLSPERVDYEHFASRLLVAQGLVWLILPRKVMTVCNGVHVDAAGNRFDVYIIGQDRDIGRTERLCLCRVYLSHTLRFWHSTTFQFSTVAIVNRNRTVVLLIRKFERNHSCRCYALSFAVFEAGICMRSRSMLSFGHHLIPRCHSGPFLWCSHCRRVYRWAGRVWKAKVSLFSR
jgi:hypothetical protein